MWRRVCVSALVLGFTAVLVLAQQQAQAPAASSPDGKLQASGNGKNISVVDAATGKEVLRIAAHKDDVTALVYAPDGKLLYSADASGTVCAIDTPTGRLIWQAKGNNKVTGLGLSVNGKTLTATVGGKGISYDAATGKQLDK